MRKNLNVEYIYEYIYCIWSETFLSACYILFNKSSVPFYSKVTDINTATEYKNKDLFCDANASKVPQTAIEGLIRVYQKFFKSHYVSP